MANLELRYIMVVEDLLAVFIGSVIHLTVKMNFVNGKALDDAGMS